MGWGVLWSRLDDGVGKRMEIVGVSGGDDGSPWEAWVLVGQLGAVIVGPIVGAVWAAVYFEVPAWLFVVLVLAGVAAGVVGAYRLVAPFLK